MIYSDLTQALGVSDGALQQSTLTLSSSTLGGNLQALQARCYGGAPIVISGASLVSEDSSAGVVVISGRANILSVPDLSVTLTASVTSAGEPKLVLRYALLGASPGANDWTFSHSFPQLPKLRDPSQPSWFDRDTGALTLATVVPLDELRFFNCDLVVCTHAGDVDGRSLAFGINFVGQLRPEGPLAMIANVFQSNAALDVQGRIVPPLGTESPQALAAQYAGNLARHAYPWTVGADFADGVPGISLQVELALSYSLGEGVAVALERLHLYSPTDERWVLQDCNPAFTPKHAFTGALELPDANIRADVVVPFTPGRDVLDFIGAFDGISLNNLSDLVGLTGGEAPLAKLPSELQAMGEQLGALSLLDASVVLDFRSAALLGVPFLSFTVGMPELSWDVVPGTFSIDSLSVSFEITSPFGSSSADPDQARQVDVTVAGHLSIEGVDFDVYASSQEGFAAYASMARGSSIPLGDILTRYAPGIPEPAALTIDVLRVGIAPGQSYSLAMAMATDEGWTLDLGPTALDVSDISMFVQHEPGVGTSGSVSGAIAVGELLTLYMSYSTPGDIVMKSGIPEISLLDLTDALCDVGLPAPSGLDLTLVNSSVLIEKSGAAYKLKLGTEVEGFGSLALQVERVNGTWGAAVGLDMHSGRLSDLPGLGALRDLERVVTLDQLCLVLSSIDNANFAFPNLAEFQNPGITSAAVPVPQGRNGVVAGLNVFTRWTLDTSKTELRVLKDVLGLEPSLDVTLVIGANPADDSRLYVGMDTTLAGCPLSCEFGFRMSSGAPSMYLAGSMVVDIQGSPVDFAVAMSALPTGLFFSGSMVGSVTFGDVTLSNLGLALGCSAAAIPSFGITGSLAVGDLRTSLAIILDSTNPSQSVLAGSIAPVTLEELTEVFTPGLDLGDVGELLSHVALEGTNGFALPASAAASLDGRDLEDIADEFLAAAGISLSASSDQTLLVVHEEGQRWAITDMFNNMRHYDLVLEGGVIQVVEEPQLYLAPAEARIGELVFHQGFFVGGALSIADLTWMTRIEVRADRGIAAESSLDGPLVIYDEDFFKLTSSDGAGGARFSMSTFSQPSHPDPFCQDPHFLLDGELDLIGLRAMAQVYVSPAGFAFALESEATTTLNWNVIQGSYVSDWSLAGEFYGVTRLGVAGSLNYQITGDVDVDKLMNVSGAELGVVHLDLAVRGALDVGYNGQGAHALLEGSFTFQGTTTGFSISQSADNAQMGRFFDLVWREVKGALKAALEVAEGFVDAVKDGWIEFTGDIDAFAASLENGYGAVDAEMTRLLLRANYKMMDITGVLKARYSATAAEVAYWYKAAGAAATWVGKSLVNHYNIAADAGAQLLKDAGYAAAEVAEALKFDAAWSATESEALSALKDAGFAAESVGEAMKDAFSVTQSELEDLVAQVGYGSTGVCRVLKGAFPDIDAEDVARVLEGMGKSSREVANRLIDEFEEGIMGGCSILRAVGYDASAAARAMNLSYGLNDLDTTKVLRNMGYSTYQTAEALYSYFQAGSEDAASYLKTAGSTATDIAKALKANDLWDKTCKETGKRLKQAGFEEDVVKDALKAAGWASSTVNDVIDAIF